jgi:hypothetical protein
MGDCTYGIADHDLAVIEDLSGIPRLLRRLGLRPDKLRRNMDGIEAPNNPGMLL